MNKYQNSPDFPENGLKMGKKQAIPGRNITVYAGSVFRGHTGSLCDVFMWCSGYEYRGETKRFSGHSVASGDVSLSGGVRSGIPWPLWRLWEAGNAARRMIARTKKEKPSRRIPGGIKNRPRWAGVGYLYRIICPSLYTLRSFIQSPSYPYGRITLSA